MSTFADKIDPSKMGVVFIEYQNEFTTDGGKLYPAVKDCMEANDLMAKSVALAEECRNKGIKVIHVPITFADDHREIAKEPYGILANIKGGSCFVGSQWGGEFCEAMTPKPDDLVVSGKRGLCAFASTNLDFLLRQNGIEVFALCGFLTNCCIESTMRTGYEHGYKSTFH
jgi:nicotinamidase-related amidase